MEGAGDSYSDLMQRLQSSVGASSSSAMVRNPKSPQQQQATSRSHSFSPHQGLPPMPTRSMPTHSSAIPSPPSSHSRSASQPSSFFSPKLPFSPSLTTPLPQGVRHGFPPLNPATTTNSFGAKRDPSSPPSVVDTLMVEDEISLPPPSISSASSLPPLSPSMSAYRRSGFDPPPTHPMDSHLPPAKRGHRRAFSDIPISFSAGAMSPPTDNRFFPVVDHGSSAREVAEMTTEGRVSSGGLVKKELDWGLCEDDGGGDEIAMKGVTTCEREEAEDDLFSMYIDLEKINGGSIDVMESSDKVQIGRGGGGEEGGKKMGNEAWGMASSDRSQSMSSIRVESLQEGGSDSSDEGESDENDRLLTGAGPNKMIGGEIRSLHSRSASVESALRIIDGSPHPLTGPPSCQSRRGRHGHSLSMDGGSAGLKLELLSVGEFDAAEVKKITASDKLIEIALADPRRAKRILANRQSAARSKERKMRYISELERKVQTLQSEATTLSAQLTHLQRDSTGLINENNELKLRLQVTEQQAQLRDALNEALREEIQRLKLVTGQVPSHQMVFNNQHSNFQMPPSQGGGSHNIPFQRFQPPMGSPQQDLTPNSFDPSFPTLKNSAGNSEGQAGTSSC